MPLGVIRRQSLRMPPVRSMAGSCCRRKNGVESMELCFRGEIVKKLFRQTVTVMIVGILISTLGMLIDGIIISNLMGKNCVAAYGLVMPVFSAFSALGNVFSTGLQAVCARHLGKGETEKARRTFSVILCFAALLVVLLMLLSFAFRNQITAFLGAKDKLAHLSGEARAYFIGLVWGLPFIIGTSIFTPLVQLDGGQSKVLVSTLMMSVSNVIADLVNYYVFHGGLFGMALATSVSYAFSFTYLLLHFLRKDSLFKFSPSGFDFGMVREVVLIGLPGAVSILCTTVRGFGINQVLRLISGDTAIAANTVMGSINSFTSAITMGIGMATTMLAGIYYGEEDRKCLRRLLGSGLRYALIGTGAVAAVLFFFPHFFVDLFLHNGDAGAASMAMSGVRLHALSMPLYAVVYLTMSFMQGTRNPKTANLICILDNLLLKLLTAAGLGAVLNVTGVWLAPLVSEILMMAVLFLLIRLRRGSSPRSLLDWMLLPEDFGVPAADELEASLAAPEDILAFAREIWDRGAENGLTEEGADAAVTAVEVIGGNVLEQNLKSGKRPHLEARFIRRKDGFTLRLRDDGRPVDTVRAAEDGKAGSPGGAGNYAALAQAATVFTSMKYTNTMRVNNTIIEL